MNAIEKEAGLWTQIRTLKKRIDSLDMGKVDPVELKSAIDSLKDLESRYADQQEKKKQRKLEKETREKEMSQQKESAPAPEVAPVVEAAPAEPTSPPMTEELTPPVEKQSEVTTEATSSNQAVVDAFLEQSNPRVRSAHLFIEQVSKDVWNLVNYNTVIAMIEGNTVKLNYGYYSVTTRIIQNKIWTTANQMGLEVMDMKTGEPLEVPKKVKKKIEPTVTDTAPVEEAPATEAPVEELEPVEKAADVAKFALDDIVEPVYGTAGSYGRVMRYDADKDLAYVHWDSGKLQADHGFGAYKGSDLRKRASKVASLSKEAEVWQLESPDEEFAAQILSTIAQRAIDGDTGEQEYLRSLWDGEKWESIAKKLQAEGSEWYVWWMDGVHNFMLQQSDDAEVSERQAADESSMDTKCESCGEALGPEVFLSKWPVCGKCTKKRHKQVTNPSDKSSEQDGIGYGGDRPGVNVAPKRDEDVSLNADSPPGWKHTVEKMKKHKDINNPFALSWWMKNKGIEPGKKSSAVEQELHSSHDVSLDIANRKWLAKHTSPGANVQGYAIFDDQNNQVMVITTDKELNKVQLEQIVFDNLGKNDLVRATLRENLSIMKKGHKVKIVAVDLQRNEVKFASLESKSLSGWTKMDKFDITIAAEEREPRMDRHCKKCGTKIPLSFEEGALCRDCERKKDHKSSLLMPLSKNEKVVRIKSSKTLTDLAQNCPDCFKKFLKFAKEKGMTVVAEDASFTVEELERHIQDMRTKMDTTKETLQTQSVETKAMKPMPTEPIDDPNYEWVYIQEKDEWVKQRKRGT